MTVSAATKPSRRHRRPCRGGSDGRVAMGVGMLEFWEGVRSCGCGSVVMMMTPKVHGRRRRRDSRFESHPVVAP